MLSIAIDGTGGAGKSTAAAGLSKLLGIPNLNSGAIYRAITYYILSHDIDVNDRNAIIKSLKDIKVEVKFPELGVQNTYLNGELVNDKLYTPDITDNSSIVSQIREVRNMVVDIQRQVAKNTDIIMEGRDTTSVVLPNANYKFFLTASIETRAKRDMERSNQNGANISFEQSVQRVLERDKRDILRDISPLILTKDSIYINTDSFTPDDVVKIMYSHIKERPNGLVF